MHKVADAAAAALNVKTKKSKFHRTSGGNYVDISLRVVVKYAKDTAMVCFLTIVIYLDLTNLDTRL